MTPASPIRLKQDQDDKFMSELQFNLFIRDKNKEEQWLKHGDKTHLEKKEFVMEQKGVMINPVSGFRGEKVLLILML